MFKESMLLHTCTVTVDYIYMYQI